MFYSTVIAWSPTTLSVHSFEQRIASVVPAKTVCTFANRHVLPVCAGNGWLWIDPKRMSCSTLHTFLPARTRRYE
jgi:hypothetical protein